MILSHAECLQKDMAYLQDYLFGRGGPLRDVEVRLRRAAFTVKPLWYPWPLSTTTISSKTVYLARNWNEWSDVSRRANLIHEARHLGQYEGKNAILWQARYLASESFRAAVEVEASVDQMFFYRHIKYRPDMDHFVSHLIDGHALNKDRKPALVMLFTNLFEGKSI